ncbi:D-galactonate dehydratase [Anaerolineaceae bacterium]|nr:D-galactonate dehydratase [Anaerolineaceae bacterium]
MKITDVKTFVVGNPPPHFGGRYWIFLKLTTDGGIVGYGEVYSVPFHPHVVAKMIEDVCERKVIGSDPFKIERLWRNIYSSGFTQRPDTSILGILSGIEMACWDIVGKALNKPVYELLGGQVHEKLRSYTYIYPEERDQPACTMIRSWRPNARPSMCSRGSLQSSLIPSAHIPPLIHASFHWKRWNSASNL